MRPCLRPSSAHTRRATPARRDFASGTWTLRTRFLLLIREAVRKTIQGTNTSDQLNIMPITVPILIVAVDLGICLACNLLDLSTELLIHIFAYLLVKDFFSVRRTCRWSRVSLVSPTRSAQWHGRPNCPFSERLEYLRRYEKAWNDLKFKPWYPYTILHEHEALFSRQDRFI